MVRDTRVPPVLPASPVDRHYGTSVLVNGHAQ